MIVEHKIMSNKVKKYIYCKTYISITTYVIKENCTKVLKIESIPAIIYPDLNKNDDIALSENVNSSDHDHSASINKSIITNFNYQTKKSNINKKNKIQNLSLKYFMIAFFLYVGLCFMMFVIILCFLKMTCIHTSYRVACLHAMCFAS